MPRTRREAYILAYGKKLLLLGGQVKEYHNFDELRPPLVSILEEAGHQVTASEDRDFLLEERIKEFDVIVLITSGGTLTSDQESGLLDAVMGSPWGKTGNPKGLVALHGASASFENSEKYQKMIGARFLTHPEMGPVISCKIVDKNHPIVMGLKDFSIVDEFYLQEYYPPFQTLVSAEYGEFTIPMAWVKNYGRGKVFYGALGHSTEQIAHPAFQTMLLNAVDWASFS